MSVSVKDQLFSFNDTFATLVDEAQKADSGLTQPNIATEPDIHLALRASGEAAYYWDIASDTIAWSENAPLVLSCPVESIATGKLFAALMDTDNVTNRFETVMNSTAKDGGAGVKYQIEYMFRNDGRKGAPGFWLEDVGHWQAGADGRPSKAYGTVRRIDERHNREQHLNFISNCDPLTGMMNRARMNEVLNEAISGAAKSGSECSFAIAAINNLAQVSEAYGYQVADEVVLAVSRRLRQVTRQGDGIARYSDHKFAVILNDCSVAELETALQRFMSITRDSVIETRQGPVWVSLSMGAVMLPQHANDVPLATALAEEALQDARRNTADAFVIYQPSPRRATERALNTRCATEIVSCLREERFRLAFQPIVNAKTGLAEMHEALLRLQETSSGELIAASHLVPVAENLGLIRLVDRAVMKLILQELGNHENIRLTMNVSGATSTDPFWYGQLLESLEANPKTAGRLMIEIAESVAMRDGKTIRNFVERLRTAGCGVAIDDFGSAHMSYHKLKELPVSMIKLDGAFIRDLSSSSDNEFVVRNMIDLASKLNLKTTAEWVESAEDAEALKSWGVDFMQGQYFGSASVERPWGAMEPGIFEMSQPEAQKPAPAVETAVEPAPKAEVSPETKQAVPEVPQQPAAEHPASDSSAPELNFSEIDSSILRLRKMLGTFPPAADGSERDAA